MAWDADRPVPWARLLKDWAIYAAIMAAIFLLFFDDDLSMGTFIGLVASLPIYLLFGSVLAKFGYTRKTMKEMREATPPRRSSDTADTAPSGRPKPPPTKRTGAGNAHRSSRKR
jgi:hypothetical protein